MDKIINDLVGIFGYIFMFLMVLRVVVATDFFSIYKSLIGFMFALIMVYITQRVVYVEAKKEEK